MENKSTPDADQEQPAMQTAHAAMLEDFKTAESFAANDPFLQGLRQFGECRLDVHSDDELIDEDEPTRIWVQRDGAIQPAEAAWFVGTSQDH
jgi:hypothetical protein